MNKREFLDALSGALGNMSWSEQERWMDFYGEMIDDRMEEGLTEAEAVAAVGSVEEIAAQIRSQPEEPKQAPKKKKWEVKPWMIVLLIVGSPLWFSLLVGIASIAFSVIVALFSVVIGFYAAAVSLVAVGLAGILLPLIFIPMGHFGPAVFAIGAGLFCAGLGILWFMGTNLLAKGVIWLCKKLISVCFRRKEAAQ